MGSPALRVINETLVQPPVNRPAAPLGRYLLDNGVLSSDQLVVALENQLTIGAPIGEIAVAEGWATPDDIQRALSQQLGLHRIDLLAHPPERRLCAELSPEFCLKYKLVPWLRLGPTVLVATADPSKFREMQSALNTVFGRAVPVVASADQLDAALAHAYRDTLAPAASARVDARFSCRSWKLRGRFQLLLTLCVLALCLATFPVPTLGGLSVLAVLSLAFYSSLKLIALLVSQLPKPAPPLPDPDQAVRPLRRPKVSVLVPLYREKEIAEVLIERITAIDYPRALLDVVLVLEGEDHITRTAVDRVDLPAWMRVVIVPPHMDLTTKPRAMNYALDFCRGDIIGIWDAEDAPEPDQINRVVTQFHDAQDDVVCLQGVLDYYNPHANWLARCFTLEYASWFRVVLQGIARMGLVVPLGGTTLFFRRDKLEELGGWDAQNVTEDADLGVRLCRSGYRTEMVDTTTYEEANCRAWPWVKQRSRWLKGFMVTYLVHMRAPVALLRDLGLVRFLGVQAFFLGTLCQFLLAPVLWSFWLMLFGLSHPVGDLLPTGAMIWCVILFLTTEVLTISLAALGAHKSGRPSLAWWAPTLMFYFPLGTLAAYKALYELIRAPFYWDKTQHGQSRPDA